MPEHLSSNTAPPLTSIQPQPHAKTLRENAARRLSRSPHPYHRQKSELPHPSERLTATASSSSLHSTIHDDDANGETAGFKGAYKDSTGSDSGTEADDEHFLKGLPAPKLRLHKGLREGDDTVSGSPSPRLSPVEPSFSTARSSKLGRKQKALVGIDSEEERAVAKEKYKHKRRIEVVRRSAEAGLLVVTFGLICLNTGVRALLWQWKRELFAQYAVTAILIALYPLRLLRNIHPTNSWKEPYSIAIPAAFDPAPLLYPPLLTLVVSSLLSVDNRENLLPCMILGIASLPRPLIPSTGGLGGSNLIQWLLACIPLFVAESHGYPRKAVFQRNPWLGRDILVLLPPLHQALCHTLHYLTTTSLLEAELQLLSIALIHLLLLGSSPQIVILKSLLWGGGVGVLVTCERVLVWGVALARVPKWRFRRANAAKSKVGRGLVQAQTAFELGKLGSLLAMDKADGASRHASKAQSNAKSPQLRINTKTTSSAIDDDSVVSAVEPKRGSIASGVEPDGFFAFSAQRRHTLPSLTQYISRSGDRTASGRKRRSQSSTIQAFVSLTLEQAIIRKWLYAGYVYLCILVIILIGIRLYVSKYALNGHEAIGWAIAYVLGNNTWLRMQVVSLNLQRWICLPPYTSFDSASVIYLGRMEDLRVNTFGEANTRLILCAYWLCVMIIGLAIVFRLSAVYEVDTRRKVFHFMMVAMLLPATYVDPAFAALALALILAIFLLLDLFRASQLPPLSKALASFLTPYVDGRDLKGPVVISHIFLLIGCAIPLWLSLGSLPRSHTSSNSSLRGWEVPIREVSMVSGVICVGMGDAAASLIGRRYGRRKWLWGGGKSIEGSVAFATAVAVALLAAKIWLRIGGWNSNNDDALLVTGVKAVFAASMASLTEAVLTGGNDNVVCPVVLWVCVKGLDI